MRSTRDHRDGGTGGYALVEITLALMLIGMLAALALPGLVRATGPAALRIAALQVSALLRDSRSDALRSGRTSVAFVEAGGRRVASRNSSALVALPAGAQASLLLADGPAIDGLGIRFFADGRSSGGDILITSATSRFQVTVSPDSGGIHVVEP